jgi:hypothetical protein
VNAGLALVLVPELLSDLGGTSAFSFLGSRVTALAFFLFGIGALTYARHPEGAVEFNKRRVLLRVAAWLDRRAGREPTAGVADATTLARGQAPALELSGDGQAVTDGAAPPVPERSPHPGRP